MAEGPEVKVHADFLSEKFKRGVLRDFKLLQGPYVHSAAPVYANFRDTLVRMQEILYNPEYKTVINTVHTKGKLIYIELIVYAWKGYRWVRENIIYLLCHLGMTGKWIEERGVHALVQLDYSIDLNGKDQANEIATIYFDDARRFGHIDFIDEENLGAKLATLGVDVLCDEFTYEAFVAAVKRSPRDILICEMLTSQNLVAGLGNIYRCDALYLAQINPFVVAHDLKPETLRKLHKAIRYVVLQSYLKGSSWGEYEPFIYGRKLGPKGELVKSQEKNGKTLWYL